MSNSQLIPAEAPITFKMGDVDVFEQDGQIWFRIQDVAKCLEYSSPDNWNRWFREGDTLLRQIDGAGQQARTFKYMRESALYRVLVKCNVPKAEPFERWVTEEVLPSIRKTGSYSTTPTISTVEEVQLAELVLSELNPTDLMFAKNMIVLKNTGIDIIAKSGVNLIATDDRHPYSPTEIGVKVAEQMGLPKAYSPNIINSCLIEMGFQTFHRDAKNNRVYEFTELGKPYGRKVPRSKNDGSPILEVRWYDTVFGPVINHLAKKEK